jgi:hypothetical protein
LWRRRWRRAEQIDSQISWAGKVAGEIIRVDQTDAEPACNSQIHSSAVRHREAVPGYTEQASSHAAPPNERMREQDGASGVERKFRPSQFIVVPRAKDSAAGGDVGPPAKPPVLPYIYSEVAPLLVHAPISDRSRNERGSDIGIGESGKGIERLRKCVPEKNAYRPVFRSLRAGASRQPQERTSDTRCPKGHRITIPSELTRPLSLYGSCFRTQRVLTRRRRFDPSTLSKLTSTSGPFIA